MMTYYIVQVELLLHRWRCLREGCDTIGFNADHSDYNYFGGGAKWKSFGSGWYGGTCGGGWGRDRRNGVFPLNLLHRTKL